MCRRLPSVSGKGENKQVNLIASFLRNATYCISKWHRQKIFFFVEYWDNWTGLADIRKTAWNFEIWPELDVALGQIQKWMPQSHFTFRMTHKTCVTRLIYIIFTRWSYLIWHCPWLLLGTMPRLRSSVLSPLLRSIFKSFGSQLLLAPCR